MFLNTNAIRIDIIPAERIYDLCLGKASTLLKSKNGRIFTDTLTVKFSRCMYIQLYLKSNFDYTCITKLTEVILWLRIILNSCKKTPVTKFKDICIKNIHGSGCLSIHYLDYQTVNYIKKEFNELDVEIGNNFSEPAIVVCNALSAHVTFRYVRILVDSSNLIRINRKGNFTIIAQTIEKYKTLIDIIYRIDQSKDECN